MTDPGQGYTDTTLEAAGNYVLAISNSKAIESLHLSWHDYPLDSVLSALKPAAPNLESFSIDNQFNLESSDEFENSDEFNPPEEFDINHVIQDWIRETHERLDGCPKLQSFGYEVSEWEWQHCIQQEDVPINNLLMVRLRIQ